MRPCKCESTRFREREECFLDGSRDEDRGMCSDHVITEPGVEDEDGIGGGQPDGWMPRCFRLEREEAHVLGSARALMPRPFPKLSAQHRG